MAIIKQLDALVNDSPDPNVAEFAAQRNPPGTTRHEHQRIWIDAFRNVQDDDDDDDDDDGFSFRYVRDCRPTHASKVIRRARDANTDHGESLATEREAASVLLSSQPCCLQALGSV